MYGLRDGVGTACWDADHDRLLPQVLQTWKTKSAKDLSHPMLLSFTTGVLCWLIYGMWIDSLPVTLANGVTLVLAGGNVVLKLKYG